MNYFLLSYYKQMLLFHKCCLLAAYLAEKPSLELCKSLIMLRDYNISGRISLGDIPVLMHMLHFWKVSIRKIVNVSWVNEIVFLFCSFQLEKNILLFFGITYPQLYTSENLGIPVGAGPILLSSIVIILKQ